MIRIGFSGIYQKRKFMDALSQHHFVLVHLLLRDDFHSSQH